MLIGLAWFEMLSVAAIAASVWISREISCKLQSELDRLEEESQRFDRDDAKDIDNDKAQRAARQWDHCCNQDAEEARQRVALHGATKPKIKEYFVCSHFPMESEKERISTVET